MDKGWTTVSLSCSTIKKLDKVREEVYRETGIFMSSYNQIIVFLINYYHKIS